MTTRPSSIRSAFLGLAALAACGGGTSGPNPPPPPPPAPIVTTLDIAPPSGALFMGDTLQLTATVRDQNGVVMAGKTVAWTSSDLTRATVSAGGMVRGVAAGSVTIMAAVEAKTGSATLSVVDPGPRITLEPARAASSTIGQAGGTITATSTAGVTYDFIVPPLALDSGVRITVTPIASLTGLPFSGGVVAGVDFQPSGLKFGPGTRLVIKHPGPLPALGPTARVVGFTTDGAGKALGVQPATPASGGFAILIEHFSTGGLAIAEVSDLTTLPLNPDGSILRRRLQELAAALSDLNALVAVFRAWRAEIEPLINLAQTGTDAKIALDLFLDWEEMLREYEDPPMDAALAGDLAALAAATQLALKRGMDALNQQCVQLGSFVDAHNVLYLQQYAEVYSPSLTGIGTGLSQQAVLATLCLQSIQSFARLPDFAPGSSTALDLTYGVKFGSNPALRGAFFDVTLTVSGAANNGVRTIQTDGAGRLPQTLIATSATPITIQVKACLGPSQLNASADLLLLGAVCHFASLTASPAPPACPGIVNGVVTGNLVVTTPSELACAASVTEVRGDLVIGADGAAMIGVADLPGLNRVDGTLVIRGLQSPGIVRLTGLRSIGALDAQGSQAVTLGLVTLDLPLLSQARSLHILGTALTALTLPNLAIDSDGLAFSVGDNPALQTLSVGSVRTSQLVISGNPVLQTATIGTIDAISVGLWDNSALQSLATSRMTSNALELFRNGLTGLSGVANATLIAFFFGANDPLGEAAALAFANRITVTSGVCSLNPDRSVFKCYTGPPWRP